MSYVHVNRSVLLAAAFLASSCLWGQATAEKPAQAPQTLAANDQIVVRVGNVAELSDKPIRIDKEGFIKLPMVGRVHAGGLTPDELEAELRTKFKLYLED